MKIAVWHNLLSGGAKRALHMHVRGLYQRGHKITIYTTSESDSNYLPLAPFGEEKIFPLPQLPRRNGLNIRRIFSLESREGRDRLNLLKKMIMHTKECMRDIEANDHDLLFANSCRFTYNTSIGIHSRIPSLLYLGEPYRYFYEAFPRLPWLLPVNASRHPLNPVKRFIESCEDADKIFSIRYQASEELKWAQSYDLILANSSFSRESILRAYNVESKVCYLGIDTTIFMPHDSPKESFVIGLGGLYQGKRVERAIHAVAAIPKSVRPPLRWYGNFADSHYQAAIIDLANSHEVDFSHKTGVSDEDLRRALSKAACFLYTPFLEPFGLAPLEANACGTAVVAIAEGGVRETIKDGINGFLAPDNDPDALASLIVRFTNNLASAAQMGKSARQHVVRHWTVEHAVDRLEQHLLALSSTQR
jgi:glycosyltransferase involved in cell wall biosynthesis